VIVDLGQVEAAVRAANETGKTTGQVLIESGDLKADHLARVLAERFGVDFTPILATPGLPELLAAKAAHGGHIRTLLAYLGAHLARLLEQPGIEIRVLEAPAHHTIYRFDEQLLLSLHLHGPDPEQAPLLHLRRAAPGGLFYRFTEHYNNLWEQDSQPINPNVDLARDEDEGENSESDPDLPTAANPAANPTVPHRHPRDAGPGDRTER